MLHSTRSWRSFFCLVSRVSATRIRHLQILRRWDRSHLGRLALRGLHLDLHLHLRLDRPHLDLLLAWCDHDLLSLRMIMMLWTVMNRAYLLISLTKMSDLVDTWPEVGSETQPIESGEKLCYVLDLVGQQKNRLFSRCSSCKSSGFSHSAVTYLEGSVHTNPQIFFEEVEQSVCC